MKNILVVLLFSGCIVGSTEELDGDVFDSDAGDTDSIGSNQLEIYASGSRIKMRVGVTADGAKTFIGWYDSVRNEDCAFMFASDGVRRCIPITLEATDVNRPTVAGVYFSDSGCSVNNVVISNTCSAPTVAFDYNPQCPGGYRVYPIAGEFTQQVYSGTPAACSPVTPGNSDFWTIGQEIPASSFQAMEEQIE